MRTINSIRNIIFGLGGQLITQVINFINRTIFIYTLGSEYLGISGLFTNILSILSLAELGVGNAIIYNMYKPIADKDYEKIKSLMKLYAKAYNFIGILMVVVGISLTPFLDIIIKDKININNLTLIYWLFLFNSVSSYFFAYKRAIISANQKEYINTINDQKFNILRNLFQILSLTIVKNYILYLIIQVIFTWISNIYIANKANKMYPFLLESNVQEISREEKKCILKNICALFTQKIGSVAVNSTDNLLISTFVGIKYVGIASNYYMIIGMINSFIMPIFNGLTASIGNLNTSENKEKSYQVYNVMLLINFWLFGMCSITLYVLIDPFITEWIGEAYLMNRLVTFIFIVNFFIKGIRRTNVTYINTLGLFWQERYKPIFEAFINIVVSILLLKKLGLVGVFLGTFISTITTSFWVEPYILHKYGFKRNINLYIKKYLTYIFIVILVGIVNIKICSFLVDNTFISIIGKTVLSMLLTNILFLIIFYKNKEFNYLKNLIFKLKVKS